MTDEVLLDRYRRLHALGSGGMGEVWLAEDTVLERRVAIKRLLPGAGPPDSTSLDRMMREARLAARLDHPNAVTIHDVVLDNGYPHLVMQYVTGRSLADRLGDGPLNVPTSAQIIGGVAAALGEAHGIGIVHRDVKPANVLLDSRGRALLADFGIARGDTDARLTQTGAFLGTPAYLAPELLHGERATPASDIYALGATLYACLEGRAPFDTEGGGPLAVIAKVLTQAMISPCNAGELTDLVLAMLSVDQDSRPTAAEVEDRLGRVGGTGGSDPHHRHADTVLMRPRRGRPPEPQDSTTVITSDRPAEDDASIDDPVYEAESSLLDAIEFAHHVSGGDSPPYEGWESLIINGIMPLVQAGDRADLFVPTLFALDPEQTSGLPRRVVRSLEKVRSGITVVVPDRVLCAWFADKTKPVSLALKLTDVFDVWDQTYDDAGRNYDAVEVYGARFIWPILFDDRELGPLRRLLVGRLRGTVTPRWHAGRVDAWVVDGADGRSHVEPGWPADS